MRVNRLALLGFVAGGVVPVAGAWIAAGRGASPAARDWSGAALDPLVWMLCALPIALAALGQVVGWQRDAMSRRRDDLLELARSRRQEMEHTAAELAARARALAASVSTVDAATAGTAGSVREATATMEDLARTATTSALAAETAIGLSRASELRAGDGIRAAESAREALLRIAEEVHHLSRTIENLEADVGEVLVVVRDMTRLAERSWSLAARAREEYGPSLVTDLERHAADARGAAARGHELIAEVHRSMSGAAAAARGGSLRAGEAAMVIEGAAGTLRELAQALASSARTAREIAGVAQEQDASIERVMRSMNAIYLAAEETAASSGRVAGEARSLDALAARLRDASRPPLADDGGTGE